MPHTNYLTDVAAAVIRSAEKHRENLYQTGTLVQNIIYNLLPMHSKPVDLILKSSANTDEFLAALHLDLMEPNERIIKAFQILHPKKPLAGPHLSDDEFQSVRRAVGNANYDKAYALLAALLKKPGTGEVFQKRVVFAAAVIGSLGGAQKNYQNFLNQISRSA